jgi:hypothetical protein
MFLLCHTFQLLLRKNPRSQTKKTQQEFFMFFYHKQAKNNHKKTLPERSAFEKTKPAFQRKNSSTR